MVQMLRTCNVYVSASVLGVFMHTAPTILVYTSSRVTYCAKDVFFFFLARSLSCAPQVPCMLMEIQPFTSLRHRSKDDPHLQTVQRVELEYCTDVLIY